MISNEELANKLIKSLSVMKNNYEALKEKRGKIQKALACENKLLKDLARDFRTLHSVIPFNTDATARKNLILKHKLKRMKSIIHHDQNQMVELQEINNQTIIKCDIERKRYEKLKLRKSSALDDLQQITEIIHYLQSTPSKEEISNQIEYELKRTEHRNQTEKQQLMFTLKALKQECDKIDNTSRSLQIKLSTKIREISDLEEKIEYKNIMVNELTSQFNDSNDKLDFHNNDLDDQFIKKDSLENRIHEFSKELHQIEEDKSQFTKLLNEKKKNYNLIRSEIKKFCSTVQEKFEKEASKLESYKKSQVQTIEKVLREKDKEIETFEKKIREVNQEIENIEIKTTAFQKEKEEEKIHSETFKKEAEEKLQSMQSVIVSLTSKILGS
ncbi:hypothetical protein TRFO_06371 [Tritrichomonas foetus]|uniref:Uncharacterized protein n=1 Tax=Tritrichomonas foetus TaxID=1144522 RepID=A0A1J4K444_9EUKA|nr:hypothetical protein TRFO_06371 [Tritrichomonas foetus]|eukprot:OHT04462.1 hypothetical protein TRFO_06371 [Tritrichomonas foetus]